MVKRWTKEEEEMLTKIHHLYTVKELAEIFQVTKNSIAQKKCRLGLKYEKENIQEGYKKCWYCKEIKTIDNFWLQAKQNDGYQTMCKQCKKIYEANRKMKEEVANKNKKLNDYVERNKNTKFYCEKCNEEKKISDYYLQVTNRGVYKRCKKCADKKNTEKKLERIKDRGY